MVGAAGAASRRGRPWFARRLRSCRRIGCGRSSGGRARPAGEQRRVRGARPGRREAAAAPPDDVVDSTGLEPKRRAAWRAWPAPRACRPTPWWWTRRKGVRGRNRTRGERFRQGAHGAAARGRRAAAALDGEGFAGVHTPGPVALVPPAFLTRPPAPRARARPVPLEFGLQLPASAGRAPAARPPRRVARAAEEAGFTSLWVMDHFLQIPPVGREWEDMLESYTTLGYLAGVTERVRLGTLVTGVTYRNIAHLGKIVATLDVLSGGRAMCGLGAGWFSGSTGSTAGTSRRRAERFALLEDALELLPLMWGPGAPRFEGRTTWWPRRPVTRGRCRSESPSSSAARGSAGRCGWWPATPTPATCSATRRRCATSSRCCTRTATPGARPGRDRGHAPRAGGRGGGGRAARGAGCGGGRGARRALSRAGRGRGADGDRGAVGRARAAVGDAVRGRDRGVPRVKRLAAALVVALLFAAGCGGREAKPKLLTETVGSGAQTTTIIRPDVDRKLPVVLFLHGWGGNRPRYYRPWLEHLAREGNAVIYPRYQDSVVEPPPQVLGNVLAGTGLALARGERGPAARSWSRAIPRAGRWPPTTPGSPAASGLPRAGRGVQRLPGPQAAAAPFGIPEVDPARIPAATRLIALAGTERPGRRHAAGAAARPPGGSAPASSWS